MSILVLATDRDDHARAVVGEVERLGGRARILDLSAFPGALQLELDFSCCGDRRFTLGSAETELDLTDVRAVWWRRPQSPQISTAITRTSHRLFAANEAHEALAGLWHALDAFWVNDPARDHVAHRKVFQLKVAQDTGLLIPRTVITNDPARARLFVDSRGYRNVIYKSFSATEAEWRETRVLRSEELDLLENVRYAPVIFQEYVEALYDLRITIVGDDIFPAAIYSQETEYPIDFRMDMANARIEPVQVPDEIAARLRRLMARLGLQYGAVDMRRTPDDRYVFLEINPAGQWLFVENVSQQPVTAALARLLLSRDGSPAR